MTVRSKGRGSGYSSSRAILQSLLRIAYRGDRPARLWAMLPTSHTPTHSTPRWRRRGLAEWVEWLFVLLAPIANNSESHARDRSLQRREHVSALENISVPKEKQETAVKRMAKRCPLEKRKAD